MGLKAKKLGQSITQATDDSSCYRFDSPYLQFVFQAPQSFSSDFPSHYADNAHLFQPDQKDFRYKQFLCINKSKYLSRHFPKTYQCLFHKWLGCLLGCAKWFGRFAYCRVRYPGLRNGYVEVFEVLGDLLFDGFVEGLGLGEFDADGFGALLHGWEERLLWGKLYKGIRNDIIMDGFK